MFEKLYEQIFFISAFLYLLFAIFLFSHTSAPKPILTNEEGPA